MPVEITLRGPKYAFTVLQCTEAREQGIIDFKGRKGTHVPVSTIFTQGDGLILQRWLEQVPDALLVEKGKGGILIYRPREAVKEVLPEEKPVFRRGERAHQRACGSGSRFREGVDGVADDGFSDVRAACQRRIGNHGRT